MFIEIDCEILSMADHSQVRVGKMPAFTRNVLAFATGICRPDNFRPNPALPLTDSSKAVVCYW